jgi:mobilome CxxCx(11)CxxC protein
MENETERNVDPRTGELWNRATDAFGTGAMFERRAQRYRRWIDLLTFFGLVFPLAIGLIVAANLLKKASLEAVIYWAGALGAAQVIIFLWSVVASWPDNLEYSSTASADNLHLSSRLKALARESNNPSNDFEVRYREAITLDDCQITHDSKRHISEFEKMFSMRAGLRQFATSCDECGEVPKSMKMPFGGHNRCPICGGPKHAKASKQPAENNR